MSDLLRIRKVINWLIFNEKIENDKDLANKLGYTKSSISQILNGKVPLSRKFIDKLWEMDRNINLDWILNESGEMFNKTISSINGAEITKAPQWQLTKRIANEGLVNFYDVDFAAGDISFYDDINDVVPSYQMDIPEFNGCTAFRTHGDSMEPIIANGSILFGTRLDDWQSHLEYGQIYGIVMGNKRKYLKYIRKSNRPEETFMLRSGNKEYDDFDIPKSKIKSIWLIHGWINKKV